MSGTEIIFEVSEDELDGGYSASALGFGIHTQGDTLDELRRNVREAVDWLLRRRHGAPAPHPAALRARRGARGLRLPRDVSGAALVAALRRLGYERVRQRGSHVRVTTQMGAVRSGGTATRQ